MESVHLPNKHHIFISGDKNKISHVINNLKEFDIYLMTIFLGNTAQFRPLSLGIVGEKHQHWHDITETKTILV